MANGIAHSSVMTHIARLPPRNRMVSIYKGSGHKGGGEWRVQSGSLFKRLSVRLGGGNNGINATHNNFRQFLTERYGTKISGRVLRQAALDTSKPLTERHVQEMVSQAQQHQFADLRNKGTFLNNPANFNVYQQMNLPLYKNRQATLQPHQEQLLTLQLKREAWNNSAITMQDMLMSKAVTPMRHVRDISDSHSKTILNHYDALKQAVRQLSDSLVQRDGSRVVSQLEEVNRAGKNLSLMLNHAGHGDLLGKNEGELVSLAFKDVALEKEDNAWLEQLHGGLIENGGMAQLLDDAATDAVRMSGKEMNAKSAAAMGESLTKAKGTLQVLQKEARHLASLQTFSPPLGKATMPPAARANYRDQMMVQYKLASPRQNCLANARSTTRLLTAATKALQEGTPLPQKLTITKDSDDAAIAATMNDIARGITDGYRSSDAFQEIKQLRDEIDANERTIAQLKTDKTANGEEQATALRDKNWQKEDRIQQLAHDYFAKETSYSQAFDALNQLHEAALSSPLAAHTDSLVRTLNPQRIMHIPKGVTWQTKDGKTAAMMESSYLPKADYEDRLRNHYFSTSGDERLRQEWGVSSLFLNDANRQRSVLHKENGETVDLLEVALKDKEPGRSRAAADALCAFAGGDKEMSSYLSNFLTQSLGNSAYEYMIAKNADFNSFATGGALTVGINSDSDKKSPDAELTRIDENHYQLRYQRSFELTSVQGSVPLDASSRTHLSVLIDIARAPSGEMNFTVREASNQTELRF